jgi:hypothetical protein
MMGAQRMTTDERFNGEELITDRVALEDLVEKDYQGLLHEKENDVKRLVSPH